MVDSVRCGEHNGLSYDEAGGGPPLLLVHAGVADSGMWDEQISALSGRFRVIRLDLRGFGRSPLPPRAFSHHEDVIGLLHALGCASACLVGASFGGAVAIDAALAHPEAVSALVLVAPGLGGYEPRSELVRDFLAKEEAALERGDLDGATELNVSLWVDGPGQAPERVPAAIRERVRLMQRRAFAIPTPRGASLVKLEPPALGRLGEIVCRTLVVTGALDVPEFVGIANIVASGIPGAESILAPAAAHLISMEKPRWFNDVLLRFLESLRA